MGINYNFVMCTLKYAGNGTKYFSSSTPREMISAALAGHVCFIGMKNVEYGDAWNLEDNTIGPTFLFTTASESDGVVRISCKDMTSSDSFYLDFENGFDSNICSFVPAS